MRAEVFIALALLLPAGATSAGPSPYGQPVRFAKGREVAFPNFTMRYLGERHVRHPVFKPGFTFFDFEVRSPRGAQRVSWSGGTGVIDSASFQVDGKPFELELRGSVAKKGWLREDEMVVWPAKEFERALERRDRESR